MESRTVISERYPRGKLRDDDEGALDITIGLRDNTVIIDFGKDVKWIGMSRPQAQEFALRILRLAADRVVSMDIRDEQQ
jgi:hypothetical protein